MWRTSKHSIQCAWQDFCGKNFGESGHQGLAFLSFCQILISLSNLALPHPQFQTLTKVEFAEEEKTKKNLFKLDLLPADAVAVGKALNV